MVVHLPLLIMAALGDLGQQERRVVLVALSTLVQVALGRRDLAEAAGLVAELRLIA
jgi:hypothetical protein